jgi:hypothetical protein
MGASFSIYLDLWHHTPLKRQRRVRFGALVEPWLERDVRPVPTETIEVRQREAPCSHSSWRSQATA